MTEKWHYRFSPEQFLRRVKIEQFIKKNEAYNENKVDTLGQPCYICKGFQGPGLLLNDKSYLCKSCFEKAASITYPEKYETLYREYIRAREARNQAKNLFIKSCFYRKTANIFSVLGFLSLLLLFIRFYYISVSLSFGILYLLANALHKKRVAKWESIYPPISGPELRHFHDPSAELTRNDLQILKIFNNWPGYPPFWWYLRDFVLNRDNHRCQVTGCPSRVELQVHHAKPVSQGGEHTPANLVTLCDFHHALEPDTGHERIWGKIRYRYFTMVRAHKRKNPVTPGFHNVKAHVRRLELIDESELEEIVRYYGISCPSCKTNISKFSIEKNIHKVNVYCGRCKKMWTGARKLAEETGPRLAEILSVSKNEGKWKCNWDMLEERSESAFSRLYSQMDN